MESQFHIGRIFPKGHDQEIWKTPNVTDGGTWYALACGSVKLEHPMCMEKRELDVGYYGERQIQKLEDRTESFDDLFPCYYASNGGVEKKCRLRHVFNWINVFLASFATFVSFNADVNAEERIQVKVTEPFCIIEAVSEH